MDPEMFARLMAGQVPRQSGLCSVGDDDPGTGGGEPAKKGADPELSKLVFDTSKAVMAKHFKSTEFKTSLAESIKASLAEALPEVLKGMTAVPPPGGDAGKGKEGQPGGQQHTDPGRKTDDPEWKAMLARQKELEDKLHQQVAERENEKAQRMRAEERSLLESQLRTNGVPDNRLRAAVALINAELKAVGRNAEGGIVYKAQRDGYVDELSVQDGIKEFLSTDEGKTFLPPPGAHGTGMRPGNALAPRQSARPGAAAGGTAANGKMDRQTALDILGNGLMHGMDRGDGI